MSRTHALAPTPVHTLRDRSGLRTGIIGIIPPAVQSRSIPLDEDAPRGEG